MIRINLLEVRPRSAKRLDAILSSGPSSTFISSREAVLGALFLVFTVVILGVLAARLGPGSEESAKAGTADVDTVEQIEMDAPLPVADLVLETSPAPQPADPSPAETPPADEPAVAPVPVGESQPAPATAPRSPSPSRTPVAVVEPIGPESQLTAVRATALADRVDVFLEMADAPAVSSFRVEKPPRLVFDISGTRLLAADPSRTQAVDSPLVNRLRIAQYTLDPPVVRLVLEVGSTPAKADVSTSAAGVSIRVSAAP